LPDGGAGSAASGEIGAPSGQIVNYQQYQNAQRIDPQLRSLQEFIQEGDNTSSLGIEVQEAQRKTRSGKMADGLVIVGVIKGSPADLAGLRAYRRTTSDVIKVVAVGAALVFPPAVLVAALADQVNIGDTYDLIIGVDGTRVTNFLDFEDRIREVQPGEIVYLNIVRNGKRMQVPVNVPANLAMPLY
jgi:S1-C subfamily serine protease